MPVEGMPVEGMPVEGMPMEGMPVEGMPVERMNSPLEIREVRLRGLHPRSSPRGSTPGAPAAARACG